MKTIEQQIRETFDAIEMPEGLKEKTLSSLAEYTEKGGTAKEDNPAFSCDSLDRKARIKAFRHNNRYVMRAIAACLLLGAVLFGLGGTYYVYAAETASAVIQSNSSVQLGLNRFGTVVRIEVDTAGLNDEELGVIAGLKGKSYEQAVSEILEFYSTKGDIQDCSVSIEVQCAHSGQCQQLRQLSDECLEKGKGNKGNQKGKA